VTRAPDRQRRWAQARRRPLQLVGNGVRVVDVIACDELLARPRAPSGTFSPQLPFTELKAEFFGTARAPVATPAFCGGYTTTATFTPSSATPAVSPTSSFPITSGPNGSPCPGSSLPFSPSLSSGVTNTNAGSFSPLTTTLTREDGRQAPKSVVLHYPPGAC